MNQRGEIAVGIAAAIMFTAITAMAYIGEVTGWSAPYEEGGRHRQVDIERPEWNGSNHPDGIKAIFNTR